MTTATQQPSRSNVSFGELLVSARPAKSFPAKPAITPAPTAAQPTRGFLETFLKALSAFAS